MRHPPQAVWFGGQLPRGGVADTAWEGVVQLLDAALLFHDVELDASVVGAPGSSAVGVDRRGLTEALREEAVGIDPSLEQVTAYRRRTTI